MANKNRRDFVAVFCWPVLTIKLGIFQDFGHFYAHQSRLQPFFFAKRQGKPPKINDFCSSWTSKILGKEREENAEKIKEFLEKDTKKKPGNPKSKEKKIRAESRISRKPRKPRELLPSAKRPCRSAMWIFQPEFRRSPIWCRQKGVSSICSDLFRFPRFLPICVPCFRECPDLFRFVPICSVFFRFVPICFQNKSEQIRETPFCRPLLQVPENSGVNFLMWILGGEFLGGEFLRGLFLLENIGPKNSTPEFDPKIRGSKIRIPEFDPEFGFTRCRIPSAETCSWLLPLYPKLLPN